MLSYVHISLTPTLLMGRSTIKQKQTTSTPTHTLGYTVSSAGFPKCRGNFFFFGITMSSCTYPRFGGGEVEHHVCMRGCVRLRLRTGKWIPENGKGRWDWRWMRWTQVQHLQKVLKCRNPQSTATASSRVPYKISYVLAMKINLRGFACPVRVGV